MLARLLFRSHSTQPYQTSTCSKRAARSPTKSHRQVRILAHYAALKNTHPLIYTPSLNPKKIIFFQSSSNCSLKILYITLREIFKPKAHVFSDCAIPSTGVIVDVCIKCIFARSQCDSLGFLWKPELRM